MPSSTPPSDNDVARMHAVLAERAPDGLLVVDGAGIVVFANAEIERLFGYDRAEIIGRPVELLVPDASSAAHAALRTEFTRAPALRAMQGSREVVGRHRDGHEIAIDVRLGPVDFAGAPHVIASVRDVGAQHERATVHRREKAAREEASFDRIGGDRKLSATAQSFGAAPLREARPSAFAELSMAYGVALDVAVERRAYRGVPPVTDNVRALTERLCFLAARPRDLVEVHTTALAVRTHTSPPGKVGAYMEEGRLLLLEIMGGLASHYRKLSLGRGT